MVFLFYTTYISVDLAHHEICRAKVGKGGIRTFTFGKHNKYNICNARQINYTSERGEMHMQIYLRIKRRHQKLACQKEMSHDM